MLHIFTMLYGNVVLRYRLVNLSNSAFHSLGVGK